MPSRNKAVASVGALPVNRPENTPLIATPLMKHCYKTLLRYHSPMARPRLHDDNLRSRLLANAGRLVTERGVDGLSLRSLAATTSTSTTAIYALFGGKIGLLGALFDESFDSFGTAQRAVPLSGDTVK